jgi:hypothetical protein
MRNPHGEWARSIWRAGLANRRLVWRFPSPRRGRLRRSISAQSCLEAAAGRARERGLTNFANFGAVSSDAGAGSGHRRAQIQAEVHQAVGQYFDAESIAFGATVVLASGRS